MNFTFLTGDVDWKTYGGSFVSKQLHNGDWPYWLVLEVTNMHEQTGDENQDKYWVTLKAVSPEAAGVGAVEAGRLIGLEQEIFVRVSLGNRDLLVVEALAQYGLYAVPWHESGNNIRVLMKGAREQADLIANLFGFYMDRQANPLGQTGWDLIRGQDIRDHLATRGK